MQENDYQQETSGDNKSLFKQCLSFLKPREPVNGFSHLLGVFLSIWGLYLLSKNAPDTASTSHLASLYIFGVSLILLYSASSLYHLLNISEKGIQLLRRIDHMMIYILIAGTYTPVCMIVLEGLWRWGLLLAIWILAFVGIILKIFWFNSPRWLSTLFYTLMGWLVIIAILPISHNIAKAGTVFLVLGGLLYTLGALIYATKWPQISSRLFGFHEIFHLFVLGGSFCHYWLVFRYLILV